MATMLKDYVSESRAPRYSILFALPLLLLYETSALLLTGSTVYGVRNGADVMLKSVFLAVGGRWGVMLFAAVLLGAGAWLVWRDQRRAGAPLERRYFGFMLAESTLYAAAFGFVVGWLTALLLGGPRMLALQGVATLDVPTQLVISVGAGIYEELLFRVVLVGLLVWVARRWLKLGPVSAAAVAVVAGALIFSAFHYIGAMGDTFTLQSFTFRFIAGLVFSAMYVTRGLGITAWTHALYDIGLTLLQA